MWVWGVIREAGKLGQNYYFSPHKLRSYLGSADGVELKVFIAGLLLISLPQKDRHTTHNIYL